MKLMDKLGGPDTYNHFPTGWAVAFSTPFQMFKRYSQYSGGTCRSAGHLLAEGHQGARRDPQPVPPLGRHRPDDPRHRRPRDAQGLPRRRAVPALRRLDALHLRRHAGCADAEEAPVLLDARHPRDLGGRLEGGHRARPVHRQGPLRPGPVAALPRRCGPFGVDGPGEAVSREAQGADEGLGRGGRINLVLPLDDRTAVGNAWRSSAPRAKPPRDRYVYYPGTAPVPEGVAVNVRNRSYKILANVEITDADAAGVIFAHGSRFGGHALFIKDHKLHYVYNFLGIKPEQQFVSTQELKPGKYTLGMEFTRDRRRPAQRVAGHDEALRQRQGRRRRSDEDAAGQVHAVRRRPLRRLRQRRRRQPASTRRPARSMAERSRASASRSKRRRTKHLELEAQRALMRD